MADDLSFRLAVPADEAALRALLAASGLPVDDLAVGRQDYLLAHAGGALVGCVGLEAHGDQGLLRSFAVVPERRNHGLGNLIFDRVVAHARARGVTTAWVLTTTAERFCLAHCFERADRAGAPPAIAATEQFRTLCARTALCFRKRLDG